MIIFLIWILVLYTLLFATVLAVIRVRNDRIEKEIHEDFKELREISRGADEKEANELTDICLHCKHHKTKVLNGVLVSDYCDLSPYHHNILRCRYFKRSWKSRFGLVREADK